MKKIDLFYMEGCPYCVNARKALAQLQKENAQYSEIEVNWIDENRDSALAEQYDYYYVPTIFFGDKKLYEANPSENYEDIKNQIGAALQTVCAQ